jgi:hypothetical protein
VSSPSHIEITVILGKNILARHLVNYLFYTGEHDTTSKLESTSLRINAKPFGFNKHWSYKFDDEQGAWYDFALIELSERVDFNRHPHIRPVCLPESGEKDYFNEDAIVSGWGLQNVDYKRLKHLGLVKGVGYGSAKKLKKLDVRYLQRFIRIVFFHHVLLD